MKYGITSNIKTIGFCAPSFGCATEPYKTRFEVATERFKRLGYEIVLGPNCLINEGVGISNKPEKCAEEFMEMYLNPNIDCLIACGGGELMCEILPYIDFDVLSKAEPKMFLGYSDITNMIFPLTTLCDTAGIYGACAGEFGLMNWHDAIQDTYEVLTSDRKIVSGYDSFEIEAIDDEINPCADYNLSEKKVLRIYKGNEEVNCTKFSGRLVGGCLDCLITLCGTRFDRTKDFSEKYKDDGIIWFLEACDLNVMSIRRALWELREADWFKYVKGFMIGRPMHYDEPAFGVDRFEAVVSMLGKFDVPIICDCDFGHLPPSMPIVSGSCACVTAKGNDIRIKYDFN